MEPVGGRVEFFVDLVTDCDGERRSGGDGVEVTWSGVADGEAGAAGSGHGELVDAVGRMGPRALSGFAGD